jgi:hypothetical protein
MAKYKPYNFDQLVMIPISLEDQLEPGTLEYTTGMGEVIEYVFIGDDCIRRCTCR